MKIAPETFYVVKKMELVDKHAHHDEDEEHVEDVKGEGEANDLDDDEDDVPIKRRLLSKKGFSCKVCQRKFSKPEAARMHVEVVHMKLYQVPYGLPGSGPNRVDYRGGH